jgi:REP element-mobilizing transposase RayT
MSSFQQIFYHIVFGTKNRTAAIERDHEEKLYKFIWGVIKKRHSHLYRINRMEDHLHIVSDLHPSISLADYVKEIKVASSFWMKEVGFFPHFAGWQEGYGAFTFSVKEKDAVVAYVKCQKEHHRQENFYDEYRRLLVDNKIPFEEKYLL